MLKPLSDYEKHLIKNILGKYGEVNQFLYWPFIRKIKGKATRLKEDVENAIDNFTERGCNRSTLEELSGLKTHGITRYIDGEMQNGDKIGIADDLITTAESKLEGRDLIKLEARRRRIDVDVIGVYVLLDREQGGRESLGERGNKAIFGSNHNRGCQIVV